MNHHPPLRIESVDETANMADRFSLFMDIAVRRAAAAPALPIDCIRQFPTTNPDTTELVGFDSRGDVRIRVEVPKDEDIEEWSTWLRRWIRQREQRELKATMRVV